jgi:hypothetical protein
MFGAINPLTPPTFKLNVISDRNSVLTKDEISAIAKSMYLTFCYQDLKIIREGIDLYLLKKCQHLAPRQ